MVRGSAADISVSAKELIRLRKKANDSTPRDGPRGRADREGALPRLLDEREEAVAYKIIDRVVTSIDDVVPAS